MSKKYEDVTDLFQNPKIKDLFKYQMKNFELLKNKADHEAKRLKKKGVDGLKLNQFLGQVQYFNKLKGHIESKIEIISKLKTPSKKKDKKDAKKSKRVTTGDIPVTDKVPSILDLDKLNKTQLKKYCKEKEIKIPSTATKAEIIKEIEKCLEDKKES